MTEQSDPHRGTRILIILAALAIITGDIHQAQTVIVWFLGAFFLAAIGIPSVRWLDQKRIPHVVAVLLVVACMATILLVIGGLVVTSLKSFYANLPYYQVRLQMHQTLRRLRARCTQCFLPGMPAQSDCQNSS